MIDGIINNGDSRRDEDEKKHSVMDKVQEEKRLRWQTTMFQSQKKQRRNRRLN